MRTKGYSTTSSTVKTTTFNKLLLEQDHTIVQVLLLYTVLEGDINYKTSMRRISTLIYVCNSVALNKSGIPKFINQISVRIGAPIIRIHWNK